MRWGGDPALVIDQNNSLGCGLTLGIQTGIDSRAQHLAARAFWQCVDQPRHDRGGGVQPFGGEGLSSTGPNAGGPNYFYRFCSEQMVVVNRAAAGGNVVFMA